MLAKIKFNSILTEININKENTSDFIAYIKKIGNKPEVQVKELLNDPNPIMCYIGDQRVIPGTETPLNVVTYTLDELQTKDPSAIMVEYDLEGKRFINCTPHDVVFHYNKTGEVIVMKPSSNPIRVYTELERDADDDNIYNKQKKVRVELPAPVDNVVYVVSQVVFGMLPERSDIVYPNTIHAVRDDNGRVIGVHSFIQR